MNYVLRKFQFEIVRFIDEDDETKLSGIKKPTIKGYVIVTRPFTYDKWDELIPDSLRVFKNGENIFPKT